MALYAELAGMLSGRRQQALDAWTERALSSYQSPDFFLQSRDAFANPVGMLIRDGLTRIFDLLCAEAEDEAFVQPVDQIVRIRAVQAFAPSQAVAPFLELRWLARHILADEASAPPPPGQWDHFACAVERVALMAFDRYCRCREELYQARVRELKSGRFRFTDGGCPTRRLAAEAERHENDEQT